MKASRLRGTAVISISEATKQGRVRDLLLDPNRRRVVALSIASTGGGPAKLIFTKDIHSVGPDAVTVRDSELLRDEHPTHGNGEVYLSRLRGMKVITESGRVMGSVADVEIDPTSFAITGYELTTGVLSELTGQRKKLPADKNVHYGKDLLVVREGQPSEEGERVPEPQPKREALTEKQ